MSEPANGLNRSSTHTLLVNKNGYPPECDIEVLEEAMEQAEHCKS